MSVIAFSFAGGNVGSPTPRLKPGCGGTADRRARPSLGRDDDLFLELGGLFGAVGRVSLAVAVRPCPREVSALDDQIFVADRAALEETFEDLARARRVACLCRQRRARD